MSQIKGIIIKHVNDIDYTWRERGEPDSFWPKLTHFISDLSKEADRMQSELEALKQQMQDALDKQWVEIISHAYKLTNGDSVVLVSDIAIRKGGE